MEPKAYTEIIKSVLEAIALSEATIHEDIQTPAAKQDKPVFFKGLDKIGQEIWSIGSKYYIVAWTHDPFKQRTDETTRSTEVWVSNATGKVNYGGDPLFALSGWNSGKAIMTAFAKSEK